MYTPHVIHWIFIDAKEKKFRNFMMSKCFPATYILGKVQGDLRMLSHLFSSPRKNCCESSLYLCYVGHLIEWNGPVLRSQSWNLRDNSNNATVTYDSDGNDGFTLPPPCKMVGESHQYSGSSISGNRKRCKSAAWMSPCLMFIWTILSGSTRARRRLLLLFFILIK